MLLGLICTIIVGILAGWIANNLMGKDSDNLLANLVLGVIGSFIGKLVAGLLGLGSHNLLGSIIIAVIGACLTIYLWDKFVAKR